ncbi:MAG TPA: hypothetical protein VK969_13685, partial [Acidimicrobiia bacterium]|nr:hypothetical protein [Acidimicrobiia bacterium]
MRRGLQLVTLLVSVAVGYFIAIFLTPGVVAPSTTPEPGERTAPLLTTTSTVVTPTTVAVSGPETYLVWATGGLTQALVESLEGRFDELSIVKGDTVELDADGGEVVPLDGLAIDPDGSLNGLIPGGVALGEASASFRNAGVGDEISIGGVVYRIAAIAPDDVVGAAEVVFAASDETAPVVTDRFALVRTDLERNELEEIVRDMYDGPAPLRIRSRDETPWLRHGDAVLPQIFIKSALGEFAYSN